MYGRLGAIFSARGIEAHGQEYPCEATVVPFNPYYTSGRGKDVKVAARVAKKTWEDDAGVAPHCNQTFHRGPLACIATFTVAFNGDPQDRMSIF